MIIQNKPITGNAFFVPSQMVVFTLALLILSLGLVSKYVPSIYSYYYYAVSDLTFSQNSKRIKLINDAQDDPSLLSSLTMDEIELILLEPSLVRRENNIKAVHYYSDNCAIDVYFRQTFDKPDYIEFRTFSLGNEVIDKNHNYCFESILSAQGIDTPNNYATRPLPRWLSPYSS